MREAFLSLLVISVLLLGCGDEHRESAIVSRDTFARQSCFGSVTAAETIARLKSSSRLTGYVIGLHDITAGPAGQVVTVGKSDDPDLHVQIILVFPEEMSGIEVHATKAGRARQDDFQLVDTIVQAGRLHGCTRLGVRQTR